MQRAAELNLIIGAQNTGKTTFLRNIIAESKKALIVTPDGAEWRHLPTVKTAQEIRNLTGAARIIYDDNDTLLIIQRNFYGGILVLDDARTYVEAKTDIILKRLYLRRRQFGIDIYLVAHGFDEVPPKCFTFLSYIVLFATNTSVICRKDKIRAEVYDKILSAEPRIAKKNAKGEMHYFEIFAVDSQIRGQYYDEAGRKNNG